MRQHPGLLVDPEGHDIVAVFVGNEHPASGRIECEEARSSAMTLLPADIRQPARYRIDGENGDAVVPSV